MKGEVEVIIDPETGQMEFEVKGIAGTRCTDITDLLTQGYHIEKEEFTSEYCLTEDSPDYAEDMI